jgi:RHS repeat-associated protein
MGAKDVYNYDNQGRELSHTRSKSDGTDSITVYSSYDKNGNKRFEKDGEGNTWEHIYDGLNRLSQSKITVNGIVQATTYGYDENGNKTSVNDWRGNTSIDIYDSLNRLIGKKDQFNKYIQKLEYNHNNVQTVSYDALNYGTYYTYDKNNRVLTTKDPEGHTTKQTYDNVGNIDTKKDGKDNLTTFGYDELGRLTSVKNAKNETTKYEYDNNGNMISQADGKNNTIYFEYNADNKISKRIYPGGRTLNADNTTYSYDFSRVVSYTYNADGSVNTVTDRNGKVTKFEYDIHGRVTSKAIGTNKVTYAYDSNGNQKTIADSTGTTERTYDALGRVTSKKVPGIGTCVYNYDIIPGTPDDGSTAEKSTDPKGNVVTKAYDKAGRLWKVIADGKTTTYSYYDNGSVNTVQYPNGLKEVYTYYKDNLLKELKNQKADGTVMDVYSYIYDAAHNMSSKIEVINGVNKGTTSYEYDSLNRLTKVTEPNTRVTGYTYDLSGNRDTETITKGSTTVNKYDYNNQNHLTKITTKVNNILSQIIDYIYDYNGNQLTVTKTPYVGGVAGTPVIVTNNYDEFNQLIKTAGTGTTVENTYNGEGLRVGKKVDGTATLYMYEYDKVVLETDASGNIEAKNVYGTNLLSRTVGTDTFYYMYNGHGDVTALIDAVSGEFTGMYYYDAFGNQTNEFIYGDVDGNGSYNSDDYAYIRQYLVGMISNFPSDTGRIAADVDGDGKITADDYAYARQMLIGMITCFPADRNEDNLVNDSSMIGYAGYFYDGETGLYYLNARMYDPTIARFLQEDTYKGDINDPLSLNLYTYCHNEPLMYTDPTGHYYQKQYVKGQGLTNVWINEEGFFGGLNNAKHTAEEALENVRDKMNEITSSAWEGTKDFVSEQIDNTKEGFIALTNSEKRKEAFELIDKYGTGSEKFWSRVYAGTAAVSGAGIVVAVGVYAAPAVLPVLAEAGTTIGTKVATTAVGGFVINNADKIINKATTITGAIRTGGDLLAGDFKSAGFDALATFESFFTGKLMTANGATGPVNKKTFAPNQSSIDANRGKNYSLIVNNGNNSSTGVGGNSKYTLNKNFQGKFTSKKTTGNANDPIVVTEDMIRAALKDAPLKTQQDFGVSLPVVQRYVNMLQEGNVAPPIKVDNGIIVNGNHRYVAGRVFGVEPEQIQWGGANPNRAVDWNNIPIDKVDWGNK